ncbi:MAG: YdbL family protein [gamma proteobacterium symbiont of Taylorina sp.]|nr:YdbL family protein [gamma proteobacterium symbiont of Taylorina sp.]
MNSITLKFNPNSIKKNQLRQLFLGLLISLTIISCVTINIYFPAAAAEKAAEQIIDEVLQSKPVDSLSEPQSNFIYRKNHSLIAVLDFFIPTAQAGQANISIESAKIRSIRNSMGKRQSKLQPYYQSGSIGFTNNGLIALVSGKKLSVKQKSKAKNLIKAENKDRNALYSEIANANGHPEWRADIQKTFSKTWINKISSGWMYQSQNGIWKKK